ncbi:hypothetical protein HHL22_14710 [Hymenobacter sp. RP-2-7]|uniref:Uncharacterized protein n=1 Tax=Hymenobacter polaris TaxID=2682546 RepID=A0A7Y0AFL3_9BACT|nr:hypothetical protein [Hymenobacter polaris]NML66460.1 hypothetical protein [Hymenobacter polaris]
MYAKFLYLDASNHEAAHDYGLRFMREETPNYTRLTIGASTEGVGLLLQLCDLLTPPFYCLYVLVIGRRNEQPGRYQSPWLETREELVNFLLDFKQPLEADGRHHLWICSPDDGATLVYDRHNLIYAYGPLELFSDRLRKLHYREEVVVMPFPHVHYFHDTTDTQVSELLNYWEWQHFPLKEVDE